MADLYQTKYELLKKKGKEKISKTQKKRHAGVTKPENGKDTPFNTREEIAKELGWAW